MVFNRNRITRTFNNTPKSNNVSTTSHGPNRISNVTTSKIDRPTNINSIISENKRTNSLSGASLSLGGSGNGQPYIPKSITTKQEKSINSQPTGWNGIVSVFNTWKDDTFMSFAEKNAIRDAEAAKLESNNNITSNNITSNDTTSNFPESRTTDMYKEVASGTDFNSGTDLFARQNAHEKLHPSIVSGKPRPYVKGMEARGISSNDSMVWNLPGTKQGSVVSNMQFQNNTKKHSGMVDEWQKGFLTSSSRDQTSASHWLNQQLGKIDSMEGQDKNKQMFKKDLTARYDNLFNTRNAPFQSNNPVPVNRQKLTRDEKKALKAQAKKDEATRVWEEYSGKKSNPDLTDEYRNLGNIY